MPFARAHDDGGISFRIEIRHDLLLRRRKNPAFHILPFPVLAIKVTGKRTSFSEVIRNEQTKGFLCHAQAPSGVQPRPQTKANVLWKNGRANTAYFHEFSQTGARAFFHFTRPSLNEGAILPEQRNNVSDGPKGHQVQVRAQIEVRQWPCFQQRVTKLENDPGATEVMKGRMAIDFRINDCNAFGQGRLRLVMVENDYIDAAFAKRPDLLDR